MGSGKNESTSPEDPERFLGEVQASLSFATFMTVVCFFFIGLLLTAEAKLEVSLRVPLYYLLLGTYGFLFSSLIYANASSFEVRKSSKKMKRHVQLGDILSEYMGLYFLILAIPLIIYGYTSDAFLGFLLLFTGHLLFFSFHQFGYSVLEIYLPRKIMVLSVVFIIIINIANFYSFYKTELVIHYWLSVSNGSFIATLFLYSIFTGESLDVRKVDI